MVTYKLKISLIHHLFLYLAASPNDNHLILKVAPKGDWSRNSSSGYPTIGISETSDAQTPSGDLIQNLNPDFNVIRVQAVMETIQCMPSDSSPLALLAQQGAEAANLVIAEKSAGVPRMKPSVGHNDRARHARSEAASTASPNWYLAEDDVRRHITQNCNAREYDRNRDDLCNVIEDQRHLRDRTPSPP
jgi:hypothetical protein